MHHIPRTLVQTTFIADVPIARLHANWTAGYVWHLFRDDDIARYLEEDPRVLRALRALATGAHRADLFRYYRLWREGGVYADIKTRFLTELGSWLVGNETLPTWYAPPCRQ